MPASSQLEGTRPAVNSTTFPPGKACGQRWLSSPGSRSVREDSFPSGVIRDRPEKESSAAIMLPSSLQLAPRPAGASHKTIGSPASSRIFLSFPAAKNPTHCPSGEKKGAYAPSVPDNGFELDSSTCFVESRFVPAEECETNTNRVPSGERTTAGPMLDPIDTSPPKSRSSFTIGGEVDPSHRVVTALNKEKSNAPVKTAVPAMIQ